MKMNKRFIQNKKQEKYLLKTLKKSKEKKMKKIKKEKKTDTVLIQIQILMMKKEKGNSQGHQMKSGNQLKN